MGGYVPITPSVASGLNTFATGVEKGIRDLASDVKDVNAPPSKKPAPPKIKDLGSFSSLADLQTHGYSKDAKAAEVAKARQLKDPSQAPTSTLRMQAVSGKLQRLQESKAFRSLRPENRLKIKGEFYDRYVAPALKANGIEPPPRDAWLEGYGKDPKDEFAEDRPKSSALGIVAGSYYGGSAAALNAINNFVYGVAKYPFKPTSGIYKQLEAERSSNAVAKAAELYSSVSTSYDSAFASRHDSAAWLANFGGHILGESPAYILAGEAIPSLAEVGALSKGGKIATSALKVASEVFLVDKSEHSPDALKDAAFAGALGILFPVLGKGAGKGFTQLLKFKGAQLANGGKPFARAIERLADEETGTTGIAPPPKPEGAEARINPEDPAVKNTVAAERALREQTAREHYPEKATASPKGSIWRNLSKEQRQKVKDHIAAGTAKAAELMPIVQPELQTTANNNELAKEILANPAFKDRLQKYAQLTGMDPAKAMTLDQAKKAARANNLDNPIHQIQDVLSPAGQVETVSAEAKEEYNLWRYKRINELRDKGYDEAKISRLLDTPKYRAWHIRNAERRIELRKIIGEHRQNIAKAAEKGRRELGFSQPLPEPEDALRKGNIIDVLRSEARERGEGDPLGLGISMGGRAFKGRSTVQAAAIAAKPGLKNFIKDTYQFLNANPITKSGRDHFPNPKHQLLWLYGYSNAPQAIKDQAYNYLRKHYAMDDANIKSSAGWVSQHYNDIVETGALYEKKYGGRFFKDTKTTQRKFGTAAQHKLYEEDIPQHDLRQVRALLRTKPELKDSVSALLTELTTLRNKAMTPAVSARRRELTRSVRDVLARYKEK